MLGEFFCRRVVLRFGQALPPDETLGRAFAWVAEAGVLAMNLAVLVGTAALGSLAVQRLRSRRFRVRFGGALLVAAGAANAALAVGASAPFLTQAALALSFAALAAVLGALAAARSGLWPWCVLSLLAYGLLTAHFLGQGPAAILPTSATLYFAGEVLAVLAALTLVPLVRPRWSLRWALAIGLPSLVLAYALQARPWTVASFSVWTVGFTLVLPGLVYALALAGYLYTLATLRQGPTHGRKLALGLLFIGLAGLKLDFSYFALLALLGVGLLPTAADQTAPAA